MTCLCIYLDCILEAEASQAEEEDYAETEFIVVASVDYLTHFILKQRVERISLLILKSL